jgi:dienelactone hydrolase
VLNIPASSSKASMDYYVSAPNPATPPTKLVIVYPDVYGFASGNHRTFADTLQSTLGPQYAVIMPDLFRGSPALRPFLFLGETGGALVGVWAMLWRLKFTFTHEVTVKGDIFDFFLPAIKELYPEASAHACVGFCYGGWLVGQSLAHETANPYTCGVGIHPSFNVEVLHRKTELGLAERIKKPILLMPAGNDSAAIKPGGDCTKCIASSLGVDESRVSKPFAAMKHGWVTRGDGKADEKIRGDQELAVKHCIAFIKEHCD